MAAVYVRLWIGRFWSDLKTDFELCWNEILVKILIAVIGIYLVFHLATSNRTMEELPVIGASVFLPLSVLVLWDVARTPYRIWRDQQAAIKQLEGASERLSKELLAYRTEASRLLDQTQQDSESTLEDVRARAKAAIDELREEVRSLRPKQWDIFRAKFEKSLSHNANWYVIFHQTESCHVAGAGIAEAAIFATVGWAAGRMLIGTSGDDRDPFYVWMCFVRSLVSPKDDSEPVIRLNHPVKASIQACEHLAAEESLPVMRTTVVDAAIALR